MFVPSSPDSSPPPELSDSGHQITHRKTNKKINRKINRIPSPDYPPPPKQPARKLSSPKSSPPHEFDKQIYTTQEIFNETLLTDPEIVLRDLTSIEANDSIFIMPIKIHRSHNPHPMFVLDSELTNYEEIIRLPDFCSRPGGVAAKYALKSFKDTDNSGIICIIITRPNADGSFTNFLAAFAIIKIEHETIEVGSEGPAPHEILNIEVICSKKYTFLGLMLWEYIKMMAMEYGIHIIHLDAVFGAIPTYLGWGFDYINSEIDANGQKIGLNEDGHVPDDADDCDTPMRYIVKREQLPKPLTNSEWSIPHLGSQCTGATNHNVLYGRLVPSHIEPDEGLDNLVFNQKHGKHFGKLRLSNSSKVRNLKEQPPKKPHTMKVPENMGLLEALEFIEGRGNDKKGEITKLRESEKHIRKYKKQLKTLKHKKPKTKKGTKKTI